MYDNADIAYNIDATITNKELQPIILLEYKYLRYTKHNRDKGSWVCTAHDGVRRRYRSVRSSIAILAGRWSGTSIAMMKSHDITIFLIPFEILAATLSKYNIEFNWEESESITQSIEVVALINAEFLQFSIDFFKKVIDAKFKNQDLTVDWYKKTFLNARLSSDEIAINSGLNKKTITNMYNSASKI